MVLDPIVLQGHCHEDALDTFLLGRFHQRCYLLEMALGFLHKILFHSVELLLHGFLGPTATYLLLQHLPIIGQLEDVLTAPQLIALELLDRFEVVSLVAEYCATGTDYGQVLSTYHLQRLIVDQTDVLLRQFHLGSTHPDIDLRSNGFWFEGLGLSGEAACHFLDVLVEDNILERGLYRSCLNLSSGPTFDGLGTAALPHPPTVLAGGLAPAHLMGGGCEPSGAC